jgi:hypothetical protein
VIEGGDDIQASGRLTIVGNAAKIDAPVAAPGDVRKAIDRKSVV